MIGVVRGRKKEKSKSKQIYEEKGKNKHGICVCLVHTFYKGRLLERELGRGLGVEEKGKRKQTNVCLSKGSDRGSQE